MAKNGRYAHARQLARAKREQRRLRTYLGRGMAGDAINALLCGAGHNLRNILRRLALLCAQIWRLLQQLAQQQNTNGLQLNWVAA